MSVLKSLWASVQGDPVFMRRVNGWLTIFWIAMIPVSVAFGLLSSVAYVSAPAPTNNDPGWADLLRRLDRIESAIRPVTPEG